MDTTTSLSLQFLGQRLVALESFTGDIAATETFVVFRQLENLLFRVVNNFKLNLTRGFKDFKRSELRAYQESHKGDLRELFGQKAWIALSMVQIPIPRALHRPYLITAEHVGELLTEARYKDALSHMCEALAVLRVADATENSQSDVDSIKLASEKLYRLWGTQGYVPDEHRLLPYLEMNERGQIETPTKDVFANVDEIKRTETVILGFEPHFTDTVLDQKDLKQLEQMVDSLITKLEHDGAPSHAYVVNFHTLIETFARFLDGYAMFLQAAQVLEHCFVLTLQTMVRAG